MKIALSWLREWVGVSIDARALGDKLTMSGFELEGVATAAPPFTGVVVAEILSAERHPQADKLQVCRVAVGSSETVQIVCGAKNARAGLKAPLAIVGASLPGGLDIKAAKLRGVDSAGMLCSAKELGLAETSEGLLELAADAPVGTDLRNYLLLDDEVLELNVTPNRGDALSVIGIAREVAALGGSSELKGPRLAAVPAVGSDVVNVEIDSPAAAPRFVGRVIRGIDNTGTSPLWLRERLRRAGVRSISPIVDVTNYVLLELGQPMHAYDLAKLRGTVRARAAKAGEAITLLGDVAITLNPDELVISDDEGAVGLAGIMGGARTAVSATTTDVFFEVAFFLPDAIAGRARRHGLQTDASQRFERGVDPVGQERAMERATQLLLEIAGGKPSATRVTERREQLPVIKPVVLRRSRLARVIGVSLPDVQVTRAFFALGMQVKDVEGGWEVVPPSYRFDIAIEADLIEEIARIVGYDNIPAAPSRSAQVLQPQPEARPNETRARDLLVARGYFESITFAFVDPALQARLFPDAPSLALANPIASDLGVMRVSLWPGLLRVALENQRRQQDRVRIFEHGARFVVQGDATVEIDTLSGLMFGDRQPEQWGAARERADFFDLKADVEALLALSGEPEAFSFRAEAIPSLHPGRSARIYRGDHAVGWLGELHPDQTRELGLTYAPNLFELDFSSALSVQAPQFVDVSRFPQVRRDLAVVVDENVALSALRERVRLTASSLLRELRVFDIYQGAGVETGRKSVALGLIFQDNSRTLTDDETDRLMASIVADLSASLNAKIRE